LDRKGFHAVNNLCHLSEKVLFQNRWRKKIVGNQVIQVNQEVGTMLYHRETPPLKHGEES